VTAAPVFDPSWDAVRERELISVFQEWDGRDSRALAALTLHRAERERLLRSTARQAIIRAHEEARQ
jgi:hypothetical protein